MCVCDKFIDEWWNHSLIIHIHTDFWWNERHFQFMHELIAFSNRSPSPSCKFLKCHDHPPFFNDEEEVLLYNLPQNSFVKMTKSINIKKIPHTHKKKLIKIKFKGTELLMYAQNACCSCVHWNIQQQKLHAHPCYLVIIYQPCYTYTNQF